MRRAFGARSSVEEHPTHNRQVTGSNPVGPTIAILDLTYFFRGRDPTDTDFESCPMIARIPLILDPQPEGGYTVTSPLLPDLITEGATISECLANAEDAFAVVMEIYEDEGRALPTDILADGNGGPVSVEDVVMVPVP